MVVLWTYHRASASGMLRTVHATCARERRLKNILSVPRKAITSSVHQEAVDPLLPANSRTQLQCRRQYHLEMQATVAGYQIARAREASMFQTQYRNPRE